MSSLDFFKNAVSPISYNGFSLTACACKHHAYSTRTPDICAWFKTKVFNLIPNAYLSKLCHKLSRNFIKLHTATVSPFWLTINFKSVPAKHSTQYGWARDERV